MSGDDAPLVGEIQSPRSVPCAMCGYDRPYVDPMSPPTPQSRPSSWLRALFARSAPAQERRCGECGRGDADATSANRRPGVDRDRSRP
jgi:hypothetical protein